ncbi:2995_t:CDS:2 [Racocetra fulgida]|uniref:2995_t:CDS:1 n=1 Tax=Racocetra fulgida TaxID=60492 RepID=A0A9N9CE48_9GLOM|nr:2995_t:CDS:2 [Racocetra fulgida]
MNEPRTPPNNVNETHQSSANIVVVDHVKADDFCTSLWSNVKEPEGWATHVKVNRI